MGVVDQIRASFVFTSNTFKLMSIRCQPQIGIECLSFSVANLDAVLSGRNVTSVRFSRQTMR